MAKAVEIVLWRKHMLAKHTMNYRSFVGAAFGPGKFEEGGGGTPRDLKRDIYHSRCWDGCTGPSHSEIVG